MRYAAACFICLTLLLATSGRSLVSHRIGIAGIGSVECIDMSFLGSQKPITIYDYSFDKRLPHVIAGLMSLLAIATTILVIRRIRTRRANQHLQQFTPHVQH